MVIELTATEACRIIKAGKDAGVRTLSFRGLKVDFGVGTPEWPSRPDYPINPARVVTLEEQAEKNLDELEMRVKDEQQSELPLTDPLEYEELIAQEELRDATDGAQEADA